MSNVGGIFIIVTCRKFNMSIGSHKTFPANTWHLPNAVSMLAHRLRRWPNIETAMGECRVFAVLLNDLMLVHCVPRWASIKSINIGSISCIF